MVHSATRTHTQSSVLSGVLAQWVSMFWRQCGVPSLTMQTQCSLFYLLQSISATSRLLMDSWVLLINSATISLLIKLFCVHRMPRYIPATASVEFQSVMQRMGACTRMIHLRLFT